MTVEDAYYISVSKICKPPFYRDWLSIWNRFGMSVMFCLLFVRGHGSTYIAVPHIAGEPPARLTSRTNRVDAMQSAWMCFLFWRRMQSQFEPPKTSCHVLWHVWPARYLLYIPTRR